MSTFNESGTVLVSWDFSNGKGSGILLVGKQRPNAAPEIINALEGEEAHELMKKLTVRNYGKGPVVG